MQRYDFFARPRKSKLSKLEKDVKKHVFILIYSVYRTTYSHAFTVLDLSEARK